MSPPTTFSTGTEIANQVRRGQLHPTTIVDAHLDRIKRRGDVTNSYITVLAEQARERAREIEQSIQNGDPVGPLAGVPIAIKDLFATKEGVRHTYGLKPFTDNIADSDATVVQRLENAGAIILGKTNTPDLGWGGGMTDNPIAGATRTPFDPERTAGGSSGGSAAAVADGLAAIAQGSDAGGSIRIPASCCGVVGVYPTFNRVPAVSRPDGFGATTPFTQSGPLARTVEDAALMLDVLSGYEPDDPYSHPESGSFLGATQQSVKGLSVAYSPTLGLFPVEERVREVVDEGVRSLESAGAEVECVDPSLNHAREVYRNAFEREIEVSYAALNEAFIENGLDLREHSETIRDRLLEFIERGYNISAVEYRRTDVVRTSLYDSIQDIFSEYDLLVSPTLATLPFGIDQGPPAEIEGESIDSSFDWFLTWPFNMTGHPAASVPAGMAEGLPVGMQVIAPRHEDASALAAAAALERRRPWSEHYPGYSEVEV